MLNEGQNLLRNMQKKMKPKFDVNQANDKETPEENHEVALENLPMHELVRKLEECKDAVASNDKNQMHRIAFGGFLSLSSM
mmetsp:Transcript_19532/g.23241  ORF Transcript_19532/g.23241 Transcript_19532/m.23241 type:complete len:81 (-) Transcript_19532:65-307(-)